MSNEVYANGMEVSCKQGAGKSICAFPDVCMTPPQTPATPPGVPIPYPNTGMASDTSDGSSSVKISDQEVMLKDKSCFKKSTGDEAGSAPMKGVLTHKNTGKVYFNAWSMDVKIEGENVVRHLDLTTHNHASKPGQTPTFPYVDRMKMAKASGACADQIEEYEKHCKPAKGGKKVQCPKRGNRTKASYAAQLENDPCQRAARCMLSPYKPSRCCKPQTPHHLVPKAGFYKTRFGGIKMNGCSGYKSNAAPCICAEGGATTATHGLLHALQRDAIRTGPFKSAKTWKFGNAVTNAGDAVGEVFPQCKDKDGSNKCIEDQLKKAHNDMGIDSDTSVRPTNKTVGPKDISAFKSAWQEVLNAVKLGGSEW